MTTPRGEHLPARTTSTRAIEEATKDVRAEKDKGAKPRGRTTTPAERETALELRRAGFADAEVQALATKPGHPCHYRLSKLPREALIALARLLPKR